MFQSFAKGRKMRNTIWQLRNNNNDVVSSFEDLANLSKSHFEFVFKEENQTTIVEFIQLSQLFPRIITDEGNNELMQEISKDELKKTLHNFQKIKVQNQMDGQLNFS